MLNNKKGLAALTGAAFLIAAGHANALTFRSDQSSGGGRSIYNYVTADPGPEIYPSYVNNDGRRVQPAGGYGIGGTEYANGVRFIHDNGGNPITMNLTVNANTPTPIDNKYLGNSTNGVNGSPSMGVKSADARLTASSNGVIAGTSLSDASIISESSVLSYIDSGDVIVPGGHTRESYAALFSGSEDPYEISTSYSLSFTQQVILEEIVFDRISHNNSTNVAPNFEIVGGSNNVNTGILATKAPATGEGSTIIPGTGGSSLGALLLANEVYTVNVYATSADSLAEFKRWNATPSNIIVSGVPYITSRISSDGVSSEPAISANARYVVFQSDADTLVNVDTNNQQDVFVYDLATDTTSNISLSSAGFQGNNDSENPDISGDGDYIVFASLASNLDTNDTNLSKDIFLRHQSGATITKISVANDGSEANGDSSNPVISADGRYVVLESAATNLVPGDNNGNTDIFLYDSNNGLINLITANGNGDSSTPDISADGRYIVFESSATNLVPGLVDNNNSSDIFVYEIATEITTLVSADSSNNIADGDSFRPVISADGRYIAFDSLATNLVSSDTNNVSDVFIRDQQSNATTRLSIDSLSTEANGASINAAISANGDFVSFESAASDLVLDDSNNATDIFVRNRPGSTTNRMSVVSSSGNEADEDSTKPSITFNGRDIAFASLATDLVSGDSNNQEDIFLSNNPTISDVQYLILTSEGTGSGTFTINPTGTDCGYNSTSCGYYPTNTEVTITATPTGTDQLVAWSGCTSTAGLVCTVTMDDYKNVIAQIDIDDPNTNIAPTLINPGNQSSIEGSGIALSISASDADGDTLVYSTSGLPTGLSINSTSGLISGTISAGSAGSYNVTVTVSDGQLNTSVNFVWAVTVAGTCGPLTQEAEAGTLSGNFVIASDASASGGQFIHVPNGNGNQNGGLNGNTAEYCFTVTQAGTYRLNAIIQASGSRDNSFFVTVDGSPSAGYLWDTRTGSGFRTDYVNDRNGADPVEFVLTPGDHTVLVYQREDGTQLDSLTLELQGAPINTAPSVTNPGTQNNLTNDNINLAIIATDVDSDPLTYSASGLPVGLSINSTSGLISGSATTAGNSNVTVTVSDGTDNSAINFAWNITQTPPVNTAPNVTNPGTQNNLTSDSINLAIIATDVDSDPLTYSASGLPVGLSINSTSGLISGVATTAGNSNVTVTVYDGTDNSAINFAWNITQMPPVNTAPSVTNPGNQSSIEGSNIALNISASDIDGDTLSYSASGLPTGLSINSGSGLISGTGSEGSYNVTVTVSDGQLNTSVNFVWTVTPIGGGTCGPLTQEAEAGILSGNFVIANDPSASGGQFIHVPNGNGNQNGGLSGNTAEYCFTVTQAGTYRLNTVIQASGSRDNSFFVTVDASPSAGYLWDTRTGSGFRTDYVNDRSGADPVEVVLAPGEHTVVVYQREDGTQLDSLTLELQGAPANNPPSVSNPGTQSNLVDDSISLAIIAHDVDGEILTYSASGLPAGLSINSGSGLISGTGSEGSYNVTVTVSDGQLNTSVNFVWTVTPIGGGSCGPLTQEAEAGILSGNFVIANDPTASGGQFIHVPNGNGNQNGGLNGNTAEYCFTVTQAGTYRLNAIIQASGSRDNSFFVTVDGSPSAGYLWDTRTGSGFRTDYVNDRNGADPVEVVLAPGEHTVFVYQREDGTQLDSLTLELQ